MTANAAVARAARSLDPAWTALAAIVAALAIAAPGQATETLRFTLDSLVSTAPFLLLSVAVAAYVKASGAEGLVARAFQGRAATMVVTGALFGALSPFCSCGVIPLVAALLAMGVPLPPVMAFWLASPIMDPGMFVITAGTLGSQFAVAKTAAAIGVGLLGGFGTMAMMRSGLFESPLRRSIDETAAAARLGALARPLWRFWGEPQRRAAFAASTRRNALFLGKWLTLAFALESLMLAYVPGEAVAGLVGGEGLASVLLAALVGIPAYLNGYAALPLAAGLLQQGMAPGAAMAFLVAGGATSVPAAMAVFAVARPPVFAAYLGFAIGGALLAGTVYGLIA